MGKRIKQKKFTPIPNWSFRIGNKNKYGDKAWNPIARILYYEILQLTEGYGRAEWKINMTDMALNVGVDRKTIYKYAKFLKGINVIEFESKKGGIAIVKVNQIILNSGKSWEQLSLLDNENGNDSPTIGEQIPKHRETDTLQKGNNSPYPPLPKEKKNNLKNNTKEEYDFETFKRNWFSANENNEPLRKKLSQRFDLIRVEPIFNELPLNNKKEVCLSTKRFVEFLQNNPNKVEWIKNASNYILTEEYKVHFKAINDEIRQENKRLEREAYLKEADRNKATDEERKEALSNWKKYT